MKKLITVSLPAVAAVAIASLSLVQLAAARPDRQMATTVQVKGGEFFFRLSTKTLAKPGKVTFVFKNIGHVSHDLKLCRAPGRAPVNACSGTHTPLIQPGKTVRLVVTFKKKGKYAYLCTVPGHAEAGMKGVLTVR
jgi:uncharacterized cupredoxin-like copper-binding protein